MKTLILSTVLLTCCGTAQDAAKKTDTETQGKPEASVPKETTTEPAKDPSTVAEPEKVEKAPQITKDQMVRASIRLGFDGLLEAGRLFHDETFKTYFLRGDEGTMSYPDSSYLPVSTKNITLGCPMGFKQVGQVDLSVGISHGLFDHLPPDSQWVWTSWKSTLDANAYSAMTTSDYVDPTNHLTYYANMFYPLHKARTVGRLYCMMDEHDLPSIDDLPEGYMDSLRGK